MSSKDLFLKTEVGRCALQVVLDWLAKLLNLPASFLAFGPDMRLGKGGGIIQASPYLL